MSGPDDDAVREATAGMPRHRKRQPMPVCTTTSTRRLHPAAARRLVPEIRGLSIVLRIAALEALQDPASTSDHLLQMADALWDVVKSEDAAGRPAAGTPICTLIEHLRHVAPEYA